MMMQVTIDEAQMHLSNLIEQALAGEEIIITRNKEPVARLVALSEIRQNRHLGLHPETVIQISEDFDDVLPEFSEHMP